MWRFIYTSAENPYVPTTTVDDAEGITKYSCKTNSDVSLMVGGLEHFFIFPYIGNTHPNWLIFFRGVAQPPTSLSRWCNSIRELLGPWFHDSQIPCWKQHSRYQAATCFPSVLLSRHGDLRVDHGAWTWNTSPSYPIDLGVSNHTLDVCPTSLPQLSHCHPTIIYHYLPTCFLYHYFHESSIVFLTILVCGLEDFLFFHTLGIINHPNCRTHIFQRGGSTTNQCHIPRIHMISTPRPHCQCHGFFPFFLTPVSLRQREEQWKVGQGKRRRLGALCGVWLWKNHHFWIFLIGKSTKDDHFQ